MPPLHALLHLLCAHCCKARIARKACGENGNVESRSLISALQELSTHSRIARRHWNGLIGSSALWTWSVLSLPVPLSELHAPNASNEEQSALPAIKVYFLDFMVFSPGFAAS
jgi:hypothetical protein